MNPVLIYTNTNKIAADKSALDLNRELFQSVYDTIKAIGITPTLQEINSLLGWTCSNNGAPDFESEYAINKLLDAAAPYNLNGVQLQRSKVKEMIVPPNTTALKEALAAAKQTPVGIVGADLALLSIVNDVITKANNSDSVIESRGTNYTLSDASATMANSLQTVCDALNAFDLANDKRIYKGLAQKIHDFEVVSGTSTPNPLKKAICGVEMRGGQFAVSLAFIRAFEQSNNI